MASKQYISIIRLFDHCGIPSGEAFNLSRTKKQLQAEFSIADGGFIEVDGYTYTRHDVFEEIERPDFTQRLIFHQQIWNSPQMLQLLEKNAVDLHLLGSEFKRFSGNQEFDAFFSPYFAGPFNYIARTLLTGHKLGRMGILLAYEDFLQPAEREEAFRPVRVFLEESIRVLRNVNRENYKIMRPKLSHWITEDWHLFFNNLPPEFYEIKNDIITFLINIGVATQKTHARDCKQVSDQLISLEETPESLRSVIVSNHAVYSGSSKKSSSFSGIFWVGWVLFMIFRLVATDGCESDSSYKERYYPIQFTPEPVSMDSATKRFVDSLIRANQFKKNP